MKLSAFYVTESRAYVSSEKFKDCDIWDSENWGSADVRVEYEYEPEDYTDHPYGSTTAREHHSASLDILTATLLTDLEQFNEEGDPTGTKIPAGTDLMKHDMWKKEYEEYFDQEIGEILAKQEPDEPDRPERDWDDR